MDRLLISTEQFEQVVVTVSTSIGLFVLMHLAKKILVKYFGAISAKTSTPWDDLLVTLLGNTKSILLVGYSIYLSLSIHKVWPQLHKNLVQILTIILLIQIYLWGRTIIKTWFKVYVDKNLGADQSRASTVRVVSALAQFAFLITLILCGLDNLGVNITTLVAGLGVGGVAVALAVQNILSDLFASLTIILDKPFVVGDAITVDTLVGKVEHIGLKTTRVRSQNGEQIIFSNNDLLKSRIRNYKTLQERRALISIELAIETSADKLGMVSGILKDIIHSQSKTRLEFSRIAGVVNGAILHETVYWVCSPDYEVYVSIQDKVYIEMFKRFRLENIDFSSRMPTLHS